MLVGYLPLINSLLRSLTFVGVITVLIAVAPPPTDGFNASLIDLKTERKATTLPDLSAIRTVVIDAGHGGRDPGCSGEHSREKHIVLGIAQKFAAKLRAAFPELEVILTRDDDTFIPLHERAAIANRARADLFISIHANFMPGSQATRGSETYVMGLHTADHNLNVAKRENSAILMEADYEANYDYDPNSDEGHILMAMVQSAYLDQSILFAEQVESQLANAGRRSRGVKQAGFVVLKETAMPSVLVEAGFLSNHREEAFLLSATGQNQVADALLESFRAYRQLMDGDEAIVPELANRSVAPREIQSVTSAPSRTPPAAPTATNSDPVIRPELNRTAQAAPQTVATPPPAPAPTARPTTYNSEALIVQAANHEVDRDLQSRELQSRPNSPQRVLPNQTAAAGNSPHPYGPTMVQARSGGPLQNSTSAPQVVEQYSFQDAARARDVQANEQYDIGIQLVASSSRIPTASPNWAGIQQPILEVQESGLYKYQIRQLPSPAAALSLRRALKEQGYPEAFIVVYHRGEKLDPTATRNLLQQ